MTRVTKRRLRFAAAALIAAAVLGSVIAVAESKSAPRNSQSSVHPKVQAWSQPLSDHGASGDEIALNGPPASDQSPPVSTLSHPMPARPIQKSASGPNASYPTEYWSSGESDTPDGAFIVKETAPNTWALTGVVADANTGVPVAGATAKLVSSSVELTTTTNTAGTFAFVDLPVGPTWTITVKAHSYGLFTGRNFKPTPMTFEESIDLAARPQTSDLSSVSPP